MKKIRRRLDFLASAGPVANTTASTAVVSVTTDRTVTIADKGKLFEADATAGAFTITLPAAATAGDDFEITVKKTDSSANAVILAADGSETILVQARRPWSRQRWS